MRIQDKRAAAKALMAVIISLAGIAIAGAGIAIGSAPAWAIPVLLLLIIMPAGWLIAGALTWWITRR
jgi:hypothetical protein